MSRTTNTLAAGAIAIVVALSVPACTVVPIVPVGPSARPATTAAAAGSTAGHQGMPPGGPVEMLAELGRLAVKGRAPLTGYSRRAFGPAWADVDHNGCDTRNDILRRDLAAVIFRPRTHDCVVARGTLADPYTGHSIAFVRGNGTSTAVQIDHVVALGDAWQTGAQKWTAQRREAFANDPLDLLAVNGSSNEAKRDSDAASWLPPNKRFRCAYVSRQIAVKSRYGLWVTSAERAAMGRVLAGCR